MDTQRKTVTILFSDVVGSTAAAGRLDPEDWAEMVGDIFACMIAPVERYGGTIARLMGDAILAFFGAPEAHEDDPQRAVLAGLDIVSGIQPLKERIQQDFGIDIDVRVGINTGLVVVGEFGAYGQTEYTAMGDAINLAARMEQTATPGTVQISQATYELIAPLVDAEPLGPVELKGKDEPEPTYRVRGVRPGRLRRRGLAALRAELTGRTRELAILQTAVSEVRRGRGRIVCLIGEAGLGKTRLVSELNAWWSDTADAEHDFWIETEAPSYGAGQPYLLFRQLIQSLAGVQDRDSPDIIVEKLQGLIAQLPLDAQAATTTHVTMVAGVGGLSSTLPAPQQSAEMAKRELFTAVTDLARSITSRRPTVWVLEDLHWADAASIELFEHVLQLSDETPVLFLFSARPERQSPAWPLKVFAELNYPHRYQEITLQPLSEEATLALTGSLLASTAISGELRGMILQKAEGNPLFVEEIVRSLIDQSVLVQVPDNGATVWRQATDADLDQIAIPDTLQGLLLERIDRLDPLARRVLQLAAVVGRTFAYRVLAAICDPIGDIDGHLATLLRVGLLREVSWFPDREYEFHHALIWEATYRTASRRQLRADHRRVGEAIETLYGNRAEEFAAELGRHFAEAADPRAASYFTLAGEAARRLHANREAAGYFSRAIDLPGAEPDPRLYLTSGATYATLGMFDTAREQLETARDQAQQHNDLETEQAATFELAGLYRSRDYAVAERYAEQALELARRLQDRRVEALALNRLGNIRANVLKFSEAPRLHRQALEIFEELNDRWGLADSWDLIGISQIFGGDIRHASPALDRAVALFEELNDLERLASTLGIYGMNYQIAVDGPYTIYQPRRTYQEYAERALAISRQIQARGSEAFALIALACTVLGDGDLDGAQRQLELARDIAAEIDHAQWRLFANFQLGLVACEMLDYEQALAHLERAVEGAEASRLPLWQEQTYARVALCQWKLGDSNAAEALLQSVVAHPGDMLSIGGQQALFALVGIAVDRRDPYAALAYLNRMVVDTDNPPAAVALQRAAISALLDQFEEADAELLRARQIALDVGPRTLLWRIATARAQLWVDRDPSIAAVEEAQALHEREALAATIADPTQRARFLAATGSHTGSVP